MAQIGEGNAFDILRTSGTNHIRTLLFVIYGDHEIDIGSIMDADALPRGRCIHADLQGNKGKQYSGCLVLSYP